MKKGTHLYFAVESDKTCKSDWWYIESIIRHFYESMNYSRKAICVGGKGNLTKKPKITAETKKARGESHVIVVADKDTNDELTNKRIVEFCEKNKYRLVWMNPNIEGVFLDDPNVKKEEKGKRSREFLEKMDSMINALDIERLSEKDPLNNQGTTNLMLVLDELIRRKR